MRYAITSEAQAQLVSALRDKLIIKMQKEAEKIIENFTSELSKICIAEAMSLADNVEILFQQNLSSASLDLVFIFQEEKPR